MPGSKRKLDEDTWIVSQSKKFKQGILLSSVYETTLAHLRLGARNFFNSLIRSRPGSPNVTAEDVAPAPPVSPSSSSNNGAPNNGARSPLREFVTASPPGSPIVRDIISDNELQSTVVNVPRPSVICQDCVFRGRNSLGIQESFGKCAYCEKLACHLNSCRGCGNEFCKDCSIAKYDSSTEAYECYNCLH